MKRDSVSPKPWYREPWPWILMAGPAIVIVAGVVTAWLAFTTADGLVEDDYYKQGLAVNQRVQRDQEAAARGLSGELLLGDDRRQLRLLLNGDDTAPRADALILRLTHPTRSGQDQNVVLALGPDGYYSGQFKTAIAGRWRVTVEDRAAKWRLVGEWSLDRGAFLRLMPGLKSSS